MKNKRLSMILIVMLLFLHPAAASALSTDDIVVLYTNDVHCAVDDGIGYAGLAAYQKDMEAIYGESGVTLVDLGDAVQGAAIGTLSKGKLLVDIMNEVGYDVVTLGNHEFDYGMARALELMDMQNAEVVSCNFTDLLKDQLVYEPYTIIDYGNAQIAYVGITTPESFTKSTPAYFQDDQGNYIYGFCEDNDGAALYKAVQAAVDAAASEGADYVVALGHLGNDPDSAPWRSVDVIANTTGIDAFLDAHSHSVIPGEIVKNKTGQDVVLSSSGTKLTAIGKLVIEADGDITTELVTDYTIKDTAVAEFIQSIKDQFEDILKTVVARTEVELTVNDPKTGSRMVRTLETNLGDLCADAYRSEMGTDIAFVNGGGVRASIPAGDITYEQIIAVHPFGNMATVVEATGQEILDALEMGARSAPSENGGFLQVSGLSYEIDATRKSNVVLDDKKNFVMVDGLYRVKNVEVGGVPLDLKKTYTLASHNYMLKSGGDGINMFMDNVILQDEVLIDNQVLINYILMALDGVVGEAYADPYGQDRITVWRNPFTDVSEASWYHGDVVYTYTKGIFAGLPGSVFAPDAPMTRAMFAALLYREAGSPAVNQKASAWFQDCPDDAWYANAVVWAAQNGIASGKTPTTFEPSAALTRQEMAGFLYRYIQSKGGGFTGMWMFLLDYTDREAISESAYEAVAYCSMNKLLVGVGEGRFAPMDVTTRAMAAAVMHRFEGMQ